MEHKWTMYQKYEQYNGDDDDDSTDIYCNGYQIWTTVHYYYYYYCQALT